MNIITIIGYAPCNLCQDTSTAPYRFDNVYFLAMKYFSNSPCYCKANYRSSNGLSPCQQCSPGSSTFTMLWANWFAYKTGATSCYCNQGYFSPTGNDDDGQCQKCPIGTTTSELSGGILFYLKNTDV